MTPTDASSAPGGSAPSKRTLPGTGLIGLRGARGTGDSDTLTPVKRANLQGRSRKSQLRQGDRLIVNRSPLHLGTENPGRCEVAEGESGRLHTLQGRQSQSQSSEDGRPPKAGQGYNFCPWQARGRDGPEKPVLAEPGPQGGRSGATRRSSPRKAI